MKSIRFFFGSLAVAVSLLGCSLANATVIEVTFSTELYKTYKIPPWELFPDGVIATRKTVASGSFSYDTNGIDRFMGVIPKIHLENQVFYNNEDWTQSYLNNEGLVATPTDWTINLDSFYGGLNNDGTFGFNFIAYGGEAGNRGFRAAGAGSPPPDLAYLVVNSNLSDWFLLSNAPQNSIPVVSSYSVSMVPEPNAVFLFAIGFLGLFIAKVVMTARRMR